MNKVDAVITGLLSGCIAMLMTASLVLYNNQNKAQCQIETTRGQVTVVRIGWTK